MPSERQRLLELALETLESKKKQIDAEIAEIQSELRGGRARRVRGPGISLGAVTTSRRRRKRSRFSKDERLKRSQRMKAYWENWRKQKGRQK